jgi:MoaA/NifB/PqqE/SkfB family radical SAM enzyme
MKKIMPKQKLKISSGWRTFLIRLKFWISLGKYTLRRNQYPLFSLSPLKGGYFKTLKIRRDIKLKKIIEFNNHCYFTLRLPHWPSKPFDYMVANGGLNFAAAGSRLKPQIDYVILAITRKCNYHCKHCYEHFNIAENDSVPIERWKDVIMEIQNIGASIINLSGGEPMLRYEGLLELLQTADKNRSDFHLHTSGHNVTPEKASELRNAGLNAAAIGLDDVNPERQDSLRGYRGSHEEATRALRYFHEADVFTYTNMCVTKDLIHSGDLWNYFELVKSLNVGAIQLLEPRPCGGYFSEEPDHLISEDERKIVTQFFTKGNREKKFKDYPQIFYISYVEAPERMGCMMGGLSHFHIDSLGNVEPCVFLPVSFGNIMEEDFLDIYKRMRKVIPHPLHRQCPSVYLSESLKAKKNGGIDLPIPYKELEEEWERMFGMI